MRKGIYDAFMKGPPNAIELFHGYTYSAHVLACAASIATLDVYREEDLFAKTKAIEEDWYDAVLSLKSAPNVLDIRCLGLTAALDLAPHKDGYGVRGYAALEHAFHELGMMIRISGDTIALTPPLIMTKNDMDEMMDKLRKTIEYVA